MGIAPPPKKIGGPKSTYLRRLRNSMATLRANISGEGHDIANWKTTLKTTTVLYTVAKFHELWSKS